LFSAFYIVDGYQSITRPGKYAPELAPALDAVLPRVKDVLPDQVAHVLPEDARGWVRVLGIAELVGGIGFTTGLMRRPSAALLAMATVPHIVAALPSNAVSEPGRDQGNLLRNIALLGGAVLGAKDTQGKPSRRWLVRYANQVTSDTYLHPDVLPVTPRAPRGRKRTKAESVPGKLLHDAVQPEGTTKKTGKRSRRAAESGRR
jgi:uncharacterized membrane protein YphA (DoxX/SURF4 family)